MRAARIAHGSHAYLHRVEGDLGNAGYWYRQAERPVPKQPLAAEWKAIAQTLLSRGELRIGSVAVGLVEHQGFADSFDAVEQALGRYVEV